MERLHPYQCIILNEMMNNVIRKYGFEAKETIEFCETVENFKNKWNRTKEDRENIFNLYDKLFWNIC